MDYKEKYEQALMVAKETYDKQPMYREWLGKMFPELKESEDERIVKELLTFFRESMHGGHILTNKEYDSWIAWLEKQAEPAEINPTEFDTRLQFLIGKFGSLPKEDLIGSLSFWMNVVQNDGTYKGEEKQSDPRSQRMISAEAKEALFDYENANIQQNDFAPKVEPKFNEGEWICENEPNNYARFIQILEIVNIQGKERYRISRDIHNDEDIVEFDFVEKYYHKFDIKDAKDGDVLAAHECFVLFKKLDGLNIRCYCTYHYMNNPSFYVDTLQNKDAFSPATKEQRDLLFQKMGEAGYMWDSDSKRLLSLKAEPSGEQKPVWSEEDEKMFNQIISIIEDADDDLIRPENISIYINWLKSRVQPQPKWKPSELQIEALESATANCAYSEYVECLIELIKQLKQL